ncbi:hypothetical protein N8T08_003277 [Aspergillus melleus]|uniref:Uncharacterized protein n=1 Tax=Aspergillus melleus TaxID=138277 RepID=A0ACC3B6P7_9EURO|nr:hypothetical protein N8T08_003277 [Aspergillus melleus]
MPFAPRRPYKLDDTSCVNDVPRVRALQEHVRKRKQIRDEEKRAYDAAEGELLQRFGTDLRRPAEELPPPARQAQKHVKACEKQSKSANQRHQRAQREFRNEWQRQRNRLVRENLERYKNEQPVIDSERQLSGKLVDEEVIGALKRTGYMAPQHMLLIDTILTMPGSTVEKEYQRRISALNAVIAFCDVEEGSPTRRPNVSQKRRADGKAKGLEEPPELIHGREAGEVQADYGNPTIFDVNFYFSEHFSDFLVGFGKAFVCYDDCFEGGLGDYLKRGVCCLRALDVGHF